MWILGDAGTLTAGQQNVRNAYDRFTGSRHTDLWLMLGDNAYNTGTDAEFQAAVFNMYPQMLRKSALWSTRGNHESATSGGVPVYYNIFSMPTAAQAGGMSSGTEAYYSFDYGDIHFICLDSYGSSRAAGSAMLNWLQGDINSTTKTWIIAFWHHPPYSKGSHNSDTEAELIEMRQNALPILEAGGVDLVLGGHSHSYERSFLLDGHYGLSGTLIPAMKKDAGSGRPGGAGSYKKLSPNPQAPNAGAVYAVAGSSGQATGGTLNHPAMFISLNNMGSMVLDVDGNTMHVKYLRDTGAIDDYFTMQKVSLGNTVPPSITTTSVPDAITNTPYSASFAADGDQPIVWSQIADALPPGMIFHPTGTYYGTPTTAGTYNFTVQALNVAPADTQAITHVVVSATPGAPVSLGATAVSASQINLAWTDTAGNETGFKIERSTDGVNFTEITTVGANVTAYSNTGLNASTQYTYRVRAYNVAGDSAYSNTSAATTQSGAPAAPTSLSAATVSSSQINLTWTDNNGNEDGTRIERSPDGVNFAQIASVGANITAYSNTGLAGGATYTYRVRAYNAGGDSPYSNTASATTLAGPPAAPTSLLLTSVSTTRIDLHWTDNSSNESNFMIERSTNGSTWMVIATLAPNVTTYSATGLNRNTRYYFRLRCWNAAGFSAYSNTANIKTKSR